MPTDSNAPGPTFEVYLEDDPTGPDLESPVVTDHIDYYETGIWLSLERERVFVPFRTVEAIRELPATAELVTSESGELVVAGGGSETETDDEEKTGTADRDAGD